MPLSLEFRKVVFWHDGKQYVFRKLRDNVEDRANWYWKFHCSAGDGSRLEITIDGRGPSLHRLPYFKTNCAGSFEVANNSLASAVLQFEQPGTSAETLETSDGAVLEMGGAR